MKYHHSTFRAGVLGLAAALALGLAAPLRADQDDTMNLAIGKRATISSTSEWCRDSHPKGANDGKVKGDYGFHTDRQVHPWWEVDLESPRNVGLVVITNRQDCCQDRARSLQLSYSSDHRNWTVVKRDPADFKTLSVDLKGASVRYIHLELAQSDPEFFHLAQVKVMKPMAAGAGPGPGMPDGSGMPGPDDQ